MHLIFEEKKKEKEILWCIKDRICLGLNSIRDKASKRL